MVNMVAELVVAHCADWLFSQDLFSEFEPFGGMVKI
jgi:hypothetical protein